MKKTDIIITPEAIEKALDVLDLNKGQNTDAIQTLEVPVVNSKVAELEKAQKAKELELVELNDQIEKAKEEDDTAKEPTLPKTEAPKDEFTYKAEGEYFRKMKKSESGEEESADENKYSKDDEGEGYSQMSNEDIEKMEKSKKKPKSTEESLEKGENATILKGIQEGLVKSAEREEAIVTLYKGLEQKLEKALDHLEEDRKEIEILRNQPLPRKSRTQPRYIEKAFNEENKNGMTEMSITRQKGAILNILESKAGLEKGENADMQMGNAMSLFETSGVMPKEIIKRLANEDKITIIR